MPQKTNNNIYGLVNDSINGLRQELNANLKDATGDLRGDIKALSDKVDTLTATVSNNATKQAVSSTKLGMLITGITVIASAIVTVIVNAILGRR